MNALIVGSIGIDDIETPREKATGLLGGSATYASISCAVHAPTRIVSVVGDDFSADQRMLLEERGIDAEGLETAAGKTFRWGGRYLQNYDERETTFTELNVLRSFDPKVPESFRNSEYVLLGNTHPTVQLKVLDQLGGPELVVIDTMNYWINNEKQLLDEALGRSDIAVVNEEEVRLYSGRHEITRATEALLDLGLDAVIVKRGAYGAAMRTRDGWFFLPGYPLSEVRDPTGAGDSFAGGVLGYLASAGSITESTLRRAVVHGSVLASFAVQGMGITGILGIAREDVMTRYREFLRFSQMETEVAKAAGEGAIA